MKTAILLLTLFAAVAGGWKNRTNTQAGQVNKNSLVCQKDTLIKLSENYGILFQKYHSEFALWYEPRIIDFDHNDTLKIKGFQYENGSDLFISVSPNEKHAVVGNIIKGYVYVSKDDSILHENYKCELIDIANAVSLNSWQSACAGEWDENSNWVYGGEILFPLNQNK